MTTVADLLDDMLIKPVICNYPFFDDPRDLMKSWWLKIRVRLLIQLKRNLWFFLGYDVSNFMNNTSK